MISQQNSIRSTWQTVMVLTLAFWFSSSLLLDFVMMPVLYTSGMMTAPGFAAAGYSMFWVFNRIELVCAALILTAALVLRYSAIGTRPLPLNQLAIAALLLDVTLIYTYGLTPQMSALGLSLDLFGGSLETPAGMAILHGGYWVLEVLKLAAGGLLLYLGYRSATTTAAPEEGLI